MAESLGEAAQAHGVPFTPKDLADFVANMLEWPIFPDVEELARLRPRKIGVLSNMDSDLLQATIARFPVEMDLAISAESVQGYKPGRAHFEAAVEQLGCPASEICHCAFGVQYDIGPASALGMKTVIVRRSPIPPSSKADAVVESLAELVELISPW